MAEEEKLPGGEESVYQERKSTKGQLESSYYTVVSQTLPDGRLLMGQDIELFPTKECPQFASPETRAYEAKDRRVTGEQIVLLCGRSAVPRVTVIGSYKSIKSQNILRLVDAGIVNWAPAGRQRFAFVFEKPAGKKILAAPEGAPHRVAEDKVIQAVIEPAVRALAEFKDMDLPHGAINAENIFIAGTPGMEKIVLGECLSSAPSWRQHPLYEVPQRAVAQAAGRGPGTTSHDLYALGVCVAMMVRGENLLVGKSPEQIIYEKIEQGSYATIIGRERISSGILEFLRGVLNDDEDMRWNVDDAVRWLEGRRHTPKQPRVLLKAARPLVFLEQKYWDLRSLAQSFSEHVPEATSEMEKGQFEIWLKRNFEDKSLEGRFDRVLAKEKEASPEKLISSVCMAIDPHGPIRYKGLSLFPWGIGMALAQALALNQDIQIYGEIISQQLLNNWVSQIFDDVPDAAGILGLLERCRSALAQKMPGYGVERALYMLNMDVVCLSPILQGHFVLTPGNLLLALEDIAKKQNRPDTILDRHMIAFISVREPKMIDPHFSYVNSYNKGHHLVGVIRTLASIQRRFSTGPVPGVTRWVVSLIAPAVELLHNRDLRQDMIKRVGRIQESGNLAAILEVVDDVMLIRDDAQRFAYAQQEYRALVVEKNNIETMLKKRRNFGLATGRQVAMLLSSITALGIILAYVVMHLLKMI
jgi:hypothetical protein